MPIILSGGKILYTTYDNYSRSEITGVIPEAAFAVCHDINVLKQIKFDINATTTAQGTLTILCDISGDQTINLTSLATAGNSFGTIQTDTGTFPVADQANDTLTITGSTTSGLSTAGNSTGDIVTIGFSSQDANKVLASAVSGSPTVPAFRALVVGDLPDLSAYYVQIGSQNGLVHPTDGSTTEYGVSFVSMVGQHNTVIGVSAGTSLTDGLKNCFYGTQVAALAEASSHNVGIGYNAMGKITDLTYSIIIGDEALGQNATTSMTNAVVIGANTLSAFNDNFTDSVVIGSHSYDAGGTKFARCVGIGSLAGSSCDVAFESNVMIGAEMFKTGVVQEASESIFIGSKVNQNTAMSGISNVLVVGNKAENSSASATNEVVIASLGGYDDYYFGLLPRIASGFKRMTFHQNDATGTNISAVDSIFTIAASRSTGAQKGGSIELQVSPSGASGSSLNTLFTLLTLDASKIITASGLISGVAPTTTNATMRYSTGTSPTSPSEGDHWNDSTQKSMVQFVDGIKQFGSGVLFTQTATGTIANSVTETAINSTGIGTLTFPVNFFVAGKTIRISGKGFHSSTASPTIRIKIKFGSTVILDTTAQTSANDTNAGIAIEGFITCRTTGASGTVFSQGYYGEYGASPTFRQMVSTATVTVDTTATQAITVTAQWGTASASNTISLTNLIVEALV